MRVYHGTSQTSAMSVVTRVDVTKGGGELGRGFYVGESIALAASFSRGKYGPNGAVVLFDINDSEYVKLNTLILNRSKYVYQLWKSLLKRQRTYLFNYDVICAPFATIEFSYQYKFESKHAESAINNHSRKKVL